LIVESGYASYPPSETTCAKSRAGRLNSTLNSMTTGARHTRTLSKALRRSTGRWYANLKALAQQNIDAYVSDNGYRKRDERYANQPVHTAKPDPLWNKAEPIKKSNYFKPADFTLAADHSHCICSAGKRLYSNGSNCTNKGYAAMKFSGAKQDCVPCQRRKECLRKPGKTPVRQVSFFQGKRDAAENHVDRMKVKIDSDMGRRIITRRFATVEPVFGNLRGNKRLHRFKLRGQTKVDGQWKLYCLMHNIEKLAHLGYAR
jgi:hypothetical protein